MHEGKIKNSREIKTKGIYLNPTYPIRNIKGSSSN
jgi:hypothetical protein